MIFEALLIRGECREAGLGGVATAARALDGHPTAAHDGVEQSLADTLVAITLTVIVASIVLHGISVTPLMNVYARTQRKTAEG